MLMNQWLSEERPLVPENPLLTVYRWVAMPSRAHVEEARALGLKARRDGPMVGWVGRGRQ